MKGREKSKSTKNDDRDFSVDEELERIVIKEDMMKKHMPPLFPQALHGKKGTNNASKIFEVLRQVKSLVKYKDPGCPTISVEYWRDLCGESLLDLGTSVNLLPYSVYKQLGLGELKPTSITLSLADRSVKILRGMIEDVLVQVDKFYYPMEWSHATHVWQHDIGAQHIPFVQEAYPVRKKKKAQRKCGMIDTLVEEHCDHRMQEDLIESFRDIEEGLPKPSDLLTTLLPWKRREEILPLFNEEETQRHVKEELQSLFLSHYPQS
ncbi:hypothetical protein CK203_109597 [Vitis vinifera]|uniref:Uncharacterized protein n=1 Tax=Vitis vinifera TaxID=29760 RepID=A0A438CFR4_VITVI|nr:hypothetical protein CK203_109597 [Vitis vinifera]